jgi:hypothetical protein
MADAPRPSFRLSEPQRGLEEEKRVVAEVPSVRPSFIHGKCPFIG